MGQTEDALTGCLVGIIFYLFFQLLFFAIKVIFWIISLPITLIFKGLGALGPGKALIALLLIGGVVGAVVLSNSELTELANQTLENNNIELSFELPEIDVSKLYENIQNSFANIFPGSSSKLSYRILYPDVRGRSCPELSCSVEAVFSTEDTINVIGFEEGVAVNGDSTWLKVSQDSETVFVHSSLAEPIEIETEIPTPTPTATPLPTATPPFGSVATITNPRNFFDGAYTSRVSTFTHEAETVFINGIWTSSQAHWARLPDIERLFNGETIGIYNASEDIASGEDDVLNNLLAFYYGDTPEEWAFSNDMLQSRDDLREGLNIARNRDINLAVSQLTTFISLRQGRLTIVAHSQGAAIVAAALRNLKNRGHNLSNITVYTFGGLAHSYPEGPTYEHCIHVADPVPYLGYTMSTTFDADNNLFTRGMNRYREDLKVIGYNSTDYDLIFNSEGIVREVDYPFDTNTHDLTDYLEAYENGECDR